MIGSNKERGRYRECKTVYKWEEIDRESEEESMKTLVYLCEGGISPLVGYSRGDASSST